MHGISTDLHVLAAKFCFTLGRESRVSRKHKYKVVTFTVIIIFKKMCAKYLNKCSPTKMSLNLNNEITLFRITFWNFGIIIFRIFRGTKLIFCCRILNLFEH